MSRTLAVVLLWCGAALLVAAGAGLLGLIGGFRRSFGASGLAAGGGAVVAGLAFLHLGFLLAPALLTHGRRGLAIGLTMPVAVLVTGAVLVVVGSRAFSSDPWLVPVLLGGVLLTHWAPVAVLLLSR